VGFFLFHRQRDGISPLFPRTCVTLGREDPSFPGTIISFKSAQAPFYSSSSPFPPSPLSAFRYVSVRPVFLIFPSESVVPPRYALPRIPSLSFFANAPQVVASSPSLAALLFLAIHWYSSPFSLPFWEYGISPNLSFPLPLPFGPFPRPYPSRFSLDPTAAFCMYALRDSPAFAALARCLDLKQKHSHYLFLFLF